MRKQEYFRYLQPEPEETTGIVKVFDYLIGLAVFGFVYFILANPVNILNNTLGPLVENNDWVMYLWYGSLVVYLIFGAFYFLSSVKGEERR